MSKFSDATIAAAQKSQRTWGVPASVSLAQFAIESAYGTRMPSGSNNPFGIKALDGQDFVTANTREVIGGKSVTVKAKFRRFADFAEAFDEHAKLLATKKIYAGAMLAWTNGNLEGGVRAMAAHYATDPTYAALVLSIIKGQGLEQYDKAQPIPTAPPATPETAPEVSWVGALINLLLSLLKGLRK